MSTKLPTNLQAATQVFLSKAFTLALRYGLQANIYSPNTYYNHEAGTFIGEPLATFDSTNYNDWRNLYVADTDGPQLVPTLKNAVVHNAAVVTHNDEIVWMD